MEDRNALINHLDSPIRILIWEASSVVIVAMGFVGGMLFDSYLSVLLPFVLLLIKKKLKKTFPSPSKHILYWYMPPYAREYLLGLKEIPSSHYREIFLYGPPRKIQRGE